MEDEEMRETDSQKSWSDHFTIRVTYVWLHEQQDFRCTYSSVFEKNDQVTVKDMITYLGDEFKKKMPTNKEGEKPVYVDYLFSYFNPNKQHYVYLGNYHLEESGGRGESANNAVISKEDMLCDGNLVLLKIRERAYKKVSI